MAKKKKEGEAKMPGGITGKGFPPGTSGNPSGRPRKLITRVVEACEERLKTIDTESGKPIAQTIGDNLINIINSGLKVGKIPDRVVVALLVDVLDRVEGKPMQQVKFSGELNNVHPEQLIEDLLGLAASRRPGASQPGGTNVPVDGNPAS